MGCNISLYNNKIIKCQMCEMISVKRTCIYKKIVDHTCNICNYFTYYCTNCESFLEIDKCDCSRKSNKCKYIIG